MRRASKPNDPADSWRASAGTPCASVWRPCLPPRMRTPPQKLARHFKALVHRFPGQRIGVVGDLMLDRYLWGTATRLSPEAAVPVVDFVVRVDREKCEPLADETQERLIRRIKTSLRQMDALVVSDYDKGVVTDALADRVLSECHRVGVPAFVKPKTSRLFSYRGTTAIVC